jgi:hypothetical protein
MGTNIFLTLCLMGEGFMVYALIQFVREGRRAKMARHSSSRSQSISMPAEGGYGLPQRRVIRITAIERRTGESQQGRRAS